MEGGGGEVVPLSMIPLLEVAYSKCQEEEKEEDCKDGMLLQQQRKRKRSSNWSEAETLQLLELRKAQLQPAAAAAKGACPKGSSAWDEIAAQLKHLSFTPRSGKHVGERWDTLRRVYMDIEEHCSKTQETYAQVLDANRDLFKFIPTEYTQKWHELIADCKPGKRRSKKTCNEVLPKPQPAEDFSIKSSVNGHSPAQTTSGRIASAFGTLISDIECILSCRKDPDKMRCADHDAGDAKVKVVASLQSVLASLKSASESTSSESYLLKIDKRELNLVEHNVRAFSERQQPRFNGVESTFRKVVWPPDDADSVMVSPDDVKSLEPGEQLSENIVNFYLKYLHSKDTRIPDVQIFKPFTKNISANLNAVKYGSVRQWMRSIFDKSYVLIPVYKEEQWSLVIVCFPGRPLSEVLESRVVAPCILHLNPSRQKAHRDMERHIRFMLLMEWTWQYGGIGVPKEISDIPFHSVVVPQEESSDDAGLFILQCAELLLKIGPETFNLAQSKGFPFLTDSWFGPSIAMAMRTSIRQVLLDRNDQEAVPG